MNSTSTKADAPASIPADTSIATPANTPRRTLLKQSGLALAGAGLAGLAPF